MSKIFNLVITASLAIAPTLTFAQTRGTGAELTRNFTSPDGTRTFKNYVIKVSGNKCIATYIFSNSVTNFLNAHTVTTWNAKKEADGTVCTGGMWKNSGGQGQNLDAFINNNGKAYTLR